MNFFRKQVTFKKLNKEAKIIEAKISECLVNERTGIANEISLDTLLEKRKQIIEEIEKLLNGKKVSELERTILTYLSENQKQLGSLNIQQIAKATYTSTSTVFRLAKKLGFAGYSEMVYKLSNHGLNTNFSESVSENARLFSNLINQVFQENQLQIIECGKCLSHKEKTVFILGTGYSGIIAEYLYKKLLGKGNYVLFSNGADTNALFLNNLNRIDIVICISKSGETALING